MDLSTGVTARVFSCRELFCFALGPFKRWDLTYITYNDDSYILYPRASPRDHTISDGADESRYCVDYIKNISYIHTYMCAT